MIDQQKIHQGQVAQVHSHYLATLAANIFNAAILVYVLRDVAPRADLALWFAAIILMASLRSIHSWYYLAHSTRKPFFPGTWGQQYVVGLAVSGVVWGAATVFFFPEGSVSHQTFLAFVVGGMVVGASVTSAALNNAFLVYGVPALAPLVARLLFMDSEIQVAMAMMLLVLFCCTVAISWQVRQTIVQLLVSRQEKDREIESRRQAQEELARHQEELEELVEARTAELRSSNRDLAEQIRQRKMTEEKYQEIFNSTNDAIFIHEAETGKIVDVNRAMLDMYGCTRDQALAMTIEEGSSCEPFFGAPEAMEKLRATVMDGPQVFEWRAKKRNKEVFWVEVALRLTTFNSSRFVIAVVRDIEARKAQEEDRLRAKKLESIGILAGGIAHDFNNILAAILGNINLACFDENMDPATKKILAAAEKASLRAKGLTQQLLTFAKGGEPVRETASLGEVIQDSASFVIRGGRCACEFDLADDLWLADIDRGQISQVIQNIVMNANHAMPSGGVIRISAENRVLVEESGAPHSLAGNWVVISIADSGIGMDRHTMERIFDPYFSTKNVGSGLGLAICQSIVNRHQGRITVESTPGKGTTFSLFLPASASQTLEKTIEPTPEVEVVGRRRILLMDDEEQVRELALAVLSRLGHDVLLARDGEEAVRLYVEARQANNPVDLTIMDLTVPGGMGGHEATQRILAVDPEARVVVSSGYSNDPIMARYAEYGFCAAIEKPYRLADLKKVIDPLLV